MYIYLSIFFNEVCKGKLGGKPVQEGLGERGSGEPIRKGREHKN